jgi:glucose/arabinose dehydrogenase
MRRLSLLLLVVALVAACSDGESSAPTTTSTSPTTTAPPATTTTAPPVRGVKLTQVATLEQPVAMAVRRGDPVVYVAEKTGRVRPLDGGAPIIDVSGNVSRGSEQGLLGLAFSPDGAFAYINYTDRAGDTHVAEHRMGAPPGELRDLLFVDQPYANHNGGHLAFGPDGLLYIGLGDGGSGNDPQNRAQNPAELLGKMLRMDPRAARPTPEIFASGLRNPWRYAFDRRTGDLWIADVGQNAVEEISLDEAPIDKGRNYEWPFLEGTHRVKGAKPAGGTGPVYEYGHPGGNCSVTGGYPYRGTALASGFDGVYFFADYCKGDLYGLRRSPGAVTAEDMRINIDAPASFGEDAAGELYVLSLGGAVYRLDPAF